MTDTPTTPRRITLKPASYFVSEETGYSVWVFTESDDGFTTAQHVGYKGTIECAESEARKMAGSLSEVLTSVDVEFVIVPFEHRND